MAVSSSKYDYWINPKALSFQLNAFGNKNLIQASVVSGTNVTVYKEGCIDYDSKGNYRKWNLTLFSTSLTSVDKYYVYVRLNRNNDSALVSFSTQKRDLEGRIYDEEKGWGEVVDEDFFYINIGAVSAAVDLDYNPIPARYWLQEIETGRLVTDQTVRESGTNELNKMFKLNSVTGLINVLASFSSAVFNQITIKNSITFGNKVIESIATPSDENDFPEPSDSLLPSTSYVKAYGDKNYISKIHDEVVEGNISFQKNINVQGNSDVKGNIVVGKDMRVEGTSLLGDVNATNLTIEKAVSESFEEGPLGSGFRLFFDKLTGRSELQVDKLLVTMRAIFTQLQIHSIKYSGGSFAFTPAGATVSAVEFTPGQLELLDTNGEILVDSSGEGLYAQDTLNTVCRCFFKKQDGNIVLKNEFQVGDLVRTQEFNVEKVEPGSFGNNFCWREVVAVGDDYIDLYFDKDTDEDDLHRAPGSGYPKIGDDVVTFGNISDPARQNIIFMNSYGGSKHGLDEAPCIIQYAGVNSFSLEGKIVTKISPDGNIFTGKDFIVETESGEKRNLFSMAKDGIVLATEAKETADEAILKMTPKNISLALINNNPIINYFDNGNFENDYIVHTGVGSIVKYSDAKFGSRCFHVSVTGWEFTLGSAKVEKGTYTFIFSLKIPDDTSGDRTDIFKLQFCKDSLWERDINDITFDAITLPSDGSWVTYKWVMTFHNVGYIRFACSGRGYGTLYLDGLMLLKGDYSGSDITNYVDYYSTSQSETNDNLLKTGIDIKERKITLTADQFEVKNNDGETTATINEDGVLEMNSGVFKGRLSLPFRQFFSTLSREDKEKNIANGFETAWDGGDSAIYRIKDLNKGANICIIGENNQYVQDSIVLPVQPEYNGTLVTIIKKNKGKTIYIETNESTLSGDIYERFGYGFISHGTYGKSIRMESLLDYEVLELMAVKIVPDKNEDGKIYEGVCAWMILNPEKFNYKDRWEINGVTSIYDGYVSKAPEELLENRIKALENKLAN